MANVYTCGYTNGDINRPATCAYPNACQYFAIAPVYNFGCCTPSNTGCYMSACYDYGTPENPNNGSIVLLAGQKFFCGSASPYCTAALYISSVPGTTYSYSSFGCLSTSPTSTVTLLQLPTSTTTTATTSSTSVSTTIAATPALTSGILSATAVASGSSQVPVPTEPSAASGSSTTPIAIGVGVGVGTTVAFIVLGLILFWYFRRRSRDSQRQVAQQAQYGYAPHDHGSGAWGRDAKDMYPVISSTIPERRAGPAEMPSERALHELSGPVSEMWAGHYARDNKP